MFAPFATQGFVTMAAAKPFLQELADGIWEKSQSDQLDLAQLTLLLPTQRAAQAMQQICRERQGPAGLLPTCLALAHLPLPAPALPTQWQQLCLLAGWLQQREGAASSGGEIWQRATQLLPVLTELLVHQLTPEMMAGAPLGDLPQHFLEQQECLQALCAAWPAVLAHAGWSVPQAQEQAALHLFWELWQQRAATHPQWLIIAGSTGSQPATAQLMRAVAAHPAGLVVLPSLEPVWAPNLPPTHPLQVFSPLSARAELATTHMGQLGAGRAASPLSRLAVAAFATPLQPIASLPANVQLCVAPDSAAEASWLALLCQQHVASGRRVSIVTSDRALAQRVQQQLPANPSGMGWWSDGAPLARRHDPLHQLAQLAWAVAQPNAHALDYLALLQHPLLGCWSSAIRLQVQGAVAQLLHGPRLASGWGNLASQLPTADTTSRQAIAMVLQALRPLDALLTATAPPSLAEWLAAHTAFVDFLLAPATLADPPLNPLAALQATLPADWLRAPQTVQDYLQVWQHWLAQPLPAQPASRLAPVQFLGPLEARLLPHDMLVLPGMVAGNWDEAAPDWWLAESQRRRWGLPDQSWRQAQQAHDWQMLLANTNELMLTRPARAGEIIHTPSRQWLRLQRLGLPEINIGEKTPHPAATPALIALRAAWQAQQQPPPYRPRPAPAPRPAAALRPKQLSASSLSRLQKNPYGYFVRDILRLQPWPDLASIFAAREAGQLWHEVLEQVLASGDPTPDRILEVARGAIGNWQADAALFVLYWPRLVLMANQFWEHWQHLQPPCRVVATEQNFSLQLAALDCCLQARADLVLGTPDQSYHLVDYKTGTLPNQKKIMSGEELQLPLLAWLASAGASKLVAKPVTGIAYWGLGVSGIEATTLTADQLAIVVAQLQEKIPPLLAHFFEPTTPYVPNPRYPDNRQEPLARQAEWAKGSSDETAGD